MMTDTNPRMAAEGLGENDVEDYTIGNETLFTPSADQEVFTASQTPQEDDYEDDDFVIEEYED